MPLVSTQTDFTIYAGETLSGTDYAGLQVFDPSPSPAITVNGVLSLTGPAGVATVGIAFGGGFYSQVVATVGTGAEIRVTGSSATGISGSWAPALVNRGLVDVRGTSGSALGVSSAYSIDNSGVIRAIGTRAARGATLSGDGAFTNSGTIEAVGGDDGTLAVSIAHLRADFVNSGTIRASDGGASRDAVAVHITSDYTPTAVIHNRGAIEGELALDLSTHYANGVQRVVNSGVITGRVELGSGRTLFENSGTVTGDVNMGQGADVWDGRQGRLVGALRGGEGDDSVAGGADADLIHGDAGADTIASGGGDDTVTGGAGADGLDGGAGYDVVSYAAAVGAVIVDLAGGAVQGAEGADTLAGFERVIGGVWGDALSGAAGSETLAGGDGHDTLDGRGGDDRLEGGKGADIFRAAGGGGVDRIVDFDAAAGDRVLIDAGVGYSLRQEGADTVIDLGAGASIVLVGVQLSSLPPDVVVSAPPPPPPNQVIASTTATVTSTHYTVPEGQTFLVTDQEGAVLYAGSNVVADIRIAGELKVVASPAPTGLGGALNGVRVQSAPYGQDRVIEVVEGGRLTVDTTAGFQTARGIYSPNTAPRMIVNNGEIEVSAQRDAYGLYSSGSSWYTSIDLVNAGVLRVTSQQAGAYGVYLPVSGRFHNAGLIEVRGLQTTYGVYFFQGSSTFFNTGSVRAIDNSPDTDSVAVFVDRSSFYGANFNNAGLLEGDIALKVVAHASGTYTQPMETFINSGRMIGRVEMGDQAQALVNSGSIEGAVNLGTGADTYDGRLGTVTGMVSGGDGGDSLAGGAAFDYLHGNAGNDTVSGGGGDDWTVGGQGNDIVDGGEGGDIVYGNLGDDWLDGAAGADVVRGGQGDDVLFGRDGDDWLSGDRGSDTLAGGAGADIFHGSQDAGMDRVTDFNAGEGDRVQLDPGTTYALRQEGADVVVDMGGEHRMLLVNVQLSTLPAGWIFGA